MIIDNVEKEKTLFSMVKRRSGAVPAPEVTWERQQRDRIHTTVVRLEDMRFTVAP